MNNYIQCSLKQGFNEYIVYIEDSAARLGNKVELKGKTGIWEVCGIFPNAYISINPSYVLDGTWEAEPIQKHRCCCFC